MFPRTNFRITFRNQSIRSNYYVRRNQSTRRSPSL